MKTGLNTYSHPNWKIDTPKGQLGILVLNTIHNRDQYNTVIKKIKELAPNADCCVTQIRENVIVKNFKDLSILEQWSIFELSIPGAVIGITKDTSTC